MPDVKWYIYSLYDGFWSNEDGWCEDFDSATIFTKEEKETFNLPIGREVKWYIIVPFTDYTGYEGQLYDENGKRIVRT